jgi:lambda family phage portal protein
MEPEPLNALDRLVGYISPARGAKRAEARARMSALTQARNYYEGATTGRRGQGWRAVSTDANGEIRGANQRLRDVARDMCRNNPHAVRAKELIAHNVVGKGIIPSVVCDIERARVQLEDLLKAHFDTTACDAEGRHTLYGLQDLAMKTVAESGEVIIRLRPRRPEDRLPLPFQLQLMEPDHLDASVDGELSNGNIAVQGVEYTAYGRIVAYHLFSAHPGISSIRSMPKSQRIPAEFVAHVFRTDRPSQARGVTWFAPVILKLRDFADFSDAQLVRQKIAACFAAFITTEDAPVTTTNPDTESSYNVESFEPGMIERLRDNEKVTFGQPPQVGDYGEYSRATLREIAAGLGVSYEALTGDLSGVNFSSGRMGWLEFQRNIDAWREHMLLPQMCQKIGEWFFNAAAGEIGRRYPAKIVWTAPRREMISPAQEVPPIVQAIRAGLTTLSEEQRKQGFDPDDLLKEYIADVQKLDAAGLILDCDPRRVTQAGNPANPAQNQEQIQ